MGTGVVCRVNDSSPDTTLTFDTPMVGKYPTAFMTAGNGLNFASDTAGTTSNVMTVISANGVTGNYTLTVNDATGIADNDYVFFAVANGTVTPTVAQYGTVEMMGVKGLIDDGTNVATLQGLSRTTYPWNNSYVSDATSQRSLTDALLHETYVEATMYGDPKFLIAHHDAVSAYGQLLSPDRRYTSIDTNLKGGFRGVEFNGMAMVADRDCPYDEIYFIDPSTISREELFPIGFLEEDGKILDRASTTAAWTATLAYYANLACFQPNRNAALRDVIK